MENGQSVRLGDVVWCFILRRLQPSQFQCKHPSLKPPARLLRRRRPLLPNHNVLRRYSSVHKAASFIRKRPRGFDVPSAENSSAMRASPFATEESGFAAPVVVNVMRFKHSFSKWSRRAFSNVFRVHLGIRFAE